MVDVVKVSLDVEFNKPFGACPCVADLMQGIMAASLGSEPIRVLMEYRFIDSF
jgi:hypothetical protein